MTLRAYTASDATLKVYRFDIPASPISGGNGACKNLKQPSVLSKFSPLGQDPEGLTVISGKVVAISEDDNALGKYSEGLNTPSTPPVEQIKNFRNTSPRFGTEAGLGYNSENKTLYNLQADDTIAGNKSVLYFKKLPLPGNGQSIKFQARPAKPQYADGLGINGNGLALATSARNLSASNPAGIYRLNLSNGALTLVSKQSASNKLGVNQDTGADFVPGQNKTLYILAEKGAFFRYTGFNATTGAGGKLTKLCTARLNAQPGETADSDFEGLATINETIASNPEAPFTFASITGIDFGLAAPIAAGIVLGGLGALVKKLYQ
jgi:hypothetical protein